MLEEESDSRWSLDSLIYYKRLLKSLLLDSLTTDERFDEEIIELDTHRLEMLRKLQLVDPMRKNRYQDLSESLFSSQLPSLVIKTDTNHDYSQSKT